MMKNRVLVAICCVLLSAGVACAAPQLVVDHADYDFGTVPQGEKVLHTFTFSNTGDEPLLISKVQSSCGCTAALLSSKQLAPGEQGEVQANFNSARFRGRIAKTIYLYSNDPLVPVKPLKIKGEVLELFNLSPRQVNFGEVKPKKTVTQEVSLENRTGEDLLIVSAETTAPELKVHFDEQLTAGGSIQVKVSFLPKPVAMRFGGYVIFKLQGKRMYDLRLPVYASVH